MQWKTSNRPARALYGFLQEGCLQKIHPAETKLRALAAHFRKMGAVAEARQSWISRWARMENSFQNHQNVCCPMFSMLRFPSSISQCWRFLLSEWRYLDAIKVLPVKFKTGIKQKHCFLQRGKFNSIGSLKLSSGDDALLSSGLRKLQCVLDPQTICYSMS